MKKVASILAVVVFAVSMVACENDSASDDELIDALELSANDKDKLKTSGGSGGN